MILREREFSWRRRRRHSPYFIYFVIWIIIISIRLLHSQFSICVRPIAETSLPPFVKPPAIRFTFYFFYWVTLIWYVDRPEMIMTTLYVCSGFRFLYSWWWVWWRGVRWFRLWVSERVVQYILEWDVICDDETILLSPFSFCFNLVWTEMDVEPYE